MKVYGGHHALSFRYGLAFCTPYRKVISGVAFHFDVYAFWEQRAVDGASKHVTEFFFGGGLAAPVKRRCCSCKTNLLMSSSIITSRNIALIFQLFFLRFSAAFWLNLDAHCLSLSTVELCAKARNEIHTYVIKVYSFKRSS